MPFDSYSQDPEILRDYLAIDRTTLANERTLLAYIRTSIALVVTGATAAKFLGEDLFYLIAGLVLVGLSLFVLAFGLWRFVRVRTKLRRASRVTETLETGLEGATGHP